MTLWIPPGYGHVVHSLLLANDSEPMAVTYGVEWDFTDPPAAGVAQTVITDLHDAFGDEICAGILPPDYTLTTSEIYWRTTADPAEALAVAVAVGNRPGVAGGAPLPQNTALLVHKRTEAAGRRGRGRFYLPGASEQSTNPNGSLVGSYHAVIQTELNQFLARVNASPGLQGMAVLHSTTLPTDDPLTLPPPYPVTTLVLDASVSTQRRRLRK